MAASEAAGASPACAAVPPSAAASISPSGPPTCLRRHCWLEACVEGVVLPLYHRDRARWTWMMRQAISKIGACFNSQRMMRRYATEAYLR